jgi:hypothetical protein
MPWFAGCEKRATAGVAICPSVRLYAGQRPHPDCVAAAKRLKFDQTPGEGCMRAPLFGLAASVNLAAIALGLRFADEGSLLVSDDYDGAAYRITIT